MSIFQKPLAEVNKLQTYWPPHTNLYIDWDVLNSTSHLGAPRSCKEIVATCNVSKVKISRCFQQILKEFDIKTEMITTDDFMQRFCRNLDLTNMLAKVALHVAKTATDMDIAPGRSPISIAAAAIYVATQVSKHEKKSVKEIADAKWAQGARTVSSIPPLQYSHQAS